HHLQPWSPRVASIKNMQCMLAPLPRRLLQHLDFLYSRTGRLRTFATPKLHHSQRWLSCLSHHYTRCPLEAQDHNRFSAWLIKGAFSAFLPPGCLTRLHGTQICCFLTFWLFEYTPIPDDEDLLARSSEFFITFLRLIPLEHFDEVFVPFL